MLGSCGRGRPPGLQDFLQVMEDVGTTARGWGALGSYGGGLVSRSLKLNRLGQFFLMKIQTQILDIIEFSMA